MRRLVLVFVPLVLAVPAPAHADIVSPAGACTANATWKANGAAADSAALSSDDVIEIARSDEVTWTGAVAGPAAGTSREVAGRVALQLPPLFGSIDLADWQGAATDVSRSGIYTYDLPSIVPSGVVLDLEASHDEGGSRHCTANVGIVIPGGPFDSPLIWGALAGLLAFAAGLAFMGRSPARPGVGKIVGGALLGLPFGLFLGLALVLFGLLSLASPLVTVLLVLGVVAGAAWTWWSPLGTRAAA